MLEGRPKEVQMTVHRALYSAIAGVGLLAATAAADPQPWPTRAMQVISPFTAGNANDSVARVVLDQVSRQVGQPFVIENKPGGGGTIGAAMVAKADPDGYTILLHSSSLSAQVVLHRTLPYDAVRDFAPVVLFGIQPNVLVAAPSTGFKTVADLVAAAKAKPGALTFASAGIGSASHMAAERLRVAAGIDVRHIPFRGAEGLAELMAGRIDFYYVPIAAAASVLGDGKVTILAVSTAACRLLESRGLTPAYVAGHSVGEYSANVAAGTFAFADALRIVRRRGRYMQEAVPAGQPDSPSIGQSKPPTEAPVTTTSRLLEAKRRAQKRKD